MNMQNASSHMVPKMIFANVLAVIMMSFEQHAPAEAKQKPETAFDDKVAKGSLAVKVADAQPVDNTLNSSNVQAEPKKRMYKSHHTANAKSPRLRLVHAAGPVDCCFRGYKS
jgi:hypothetical protein